MRYSLSIFLTIGILFLFSWAWAGKANATWISFPWQAEAMITGTTPDSKVSGNVAFAEINGGLNVHGDFSNLTPGKHGFHIHENGSCAEVGKSAGGHFNPDKVTHGYMPKDGMMHAHPGDMGNIEADADGKATLDIFLPGVTLKEGKYAVFGRSVIVHEKEDDFSQPTGNAGSRVGCGAIEAPKFRGPVCEKGRCPG